MLKIWIAFKSIYIGEFKNGVKEGKGKWKKDRNDPESNQYEGEYKNDKKHGFGVFKWKSGNKYKGGYQDDERHGYGEMYWTDGSSYKGMWHKGIQHGKGKMEFPNGVVKDGEFENNIFLKRDVLNHTVYTGRPYISNINNSSVDRIANSTAMTFDSDYKQRTTSETDTLFKKKIKVNMNDAFPKI